MEIKVEITLGFRALLGLGGGNDSENHHIIDALARTWGFWFRGYSFGYVENEEGLQTDYFTDLLYYSVLTTQPGGRPDSSTSSRER